MIPLTRHQQQLFLTPRLCTDTTYVLNALDKSNHQMSKCKQQRLLRECLCSALFLHYSQTFYGLFWNIYVENIKTKCFLSRVSAPWRAGLLAFSAVLEMPVYAWLLSMHTYAHNSSVSRRSFLGPAALPLISFSQETEILLLSGISN